MPSLYDAFTGTTAESRAKEEEARQAEERRVREERLKRLEEKIKALKEKNNPADAELTKDLEEMIKLSRAFWKRNDAFESRR